jgi:hypothetical protein
MTPGWPPNESPGRRTTSTVGPTWPTPSPGYSPTRKPAPTCSTPPVLRTWRRFSTWSAVDRPVNVLATRGAPSVAQLAAVGVRRVAIGGAFAFVALGAMAEAAREFRDDGTYGLLDLAVSGSRAARSAFRDQG